MVAQKVSLSMFHKHFADMLEHVVAGYPNEAWEHWALKIIE